MRQLFILAFAASLIACSASSGQQAGPVRQASESNPDTIAPVPHHEVSAKGIADEGGKEDAEPIRAPAPQPVLSELNLSWYDRSAALADRETLGKTFDKRGYTPPRESYLLIGRISKIAGKPAFTWFSLGDTGFDASADSFWPASMVKLIAAVGALETLHAQGLNGSSKISFTDGRGEYSGNASRLYGSALSHSNNVAYDRLIKIAGFDALNEDLLSPSNGFPFMTMQCSYDKENDPSLRTSPAIEYEDKKLTGVIPERTSEAVHEQCPEGANCATLFELLHLLARVVLHDEMDVEDRFNLHWTDKKALRRYLEKAPTRIGPGIEEALGHPITVYNKGGRVPDMVANDHALAVDEENGRRYLVAASIAEDHSKDETKAMIAELVHRGMEAVAYKMNRGFPVARDGGVPLEFAWNPVGEEGEAVSVSVSAPQEVDSLKLFEGSKEIAVSAGEPISIERPVPGEKPQLYVAVARKGKRIVGYKSLGLAMR